MGFVAKTFRAGAIFFVAFLVWGGGSIVHAQGALLDQPSSVFVSGSYAYVTATQSNALEIIDVSNPLYPQHVSSITEGAGGTTIHSPSSVFVAGNYAYVTSFFGNTLHIIDISDPANPVPRGKLSHGEGLSLIRPTNVEVWGNYAYVASRGSSNINIIDISDPANPSPVSNLGFGSLNIPNFVTVLGNYMYIVLAVSGGSGSLQIVDISNPSLPVMQGVLYDGTDGASLNNPTFVYVSGNYAYITSQSGLALEIIDVSDPNNPIHRGKIFNGDGGAELLSPQDVFVKGNYAYVTATSGQSLEVVDISDPSSPSHAGKLLHGSGGASLNTPVSIFVEGDYAYIASDIDDTLEIVSISDPANPVHASKISNGETGVPPSTASKNPVLIVPGVLGTEIFNGSEKLWLDGQRTATDLGDQFMDALQLDQDLNPININLTLGEVIGEAPRLDYSKGLVDEFILQNYALNTDIFLFPYDWRYGVSQNNIDLLRQKIQDIMTQTGAAKVDIIAHSTGGLLVKKYVIDNPSSHDIDKAVFVGVPNTGAPKAIKVFLQGDGFDNPFLADSEMKKLAVNLPVVYDLAPSRTYFNNKGSYVTVVEQGLLNSISDDLSYDEVNNFLANDHQLNLTAITNAENLHTFSFDNYDMRTAGVDLYNIVGCKAGTIGKVIETRTQTILGGIKTTHKVERIPGDGTVPIESATNLPMDSNNKYYSLEGKHATMMTQNGTRQQIVNILSGSTLPTENITQDISQCELNGKAISVFSPVSLEITDQNGNKSGLDNQGNIFNEIPNADFVVMGEEKFAYLPTDEGQTYSISLRGTGNGTFTIENSEIENNQTTQVETFKDIPVTTNLTGSLDIENSLLTLDIDGNGEIDQVISPNGQELSLGDILALLKSKAQSLSAKDKVKQNLLKRIENLEKKIENKKIKNAKILEKFKNKISNQELKGKISAGDAASILELLEYLEVKAEEGVKFEADVLQALRTRIQALTVKVNQKNDILKRVGRLENKQRITQALSNLTLNVLKKNNLGKIENTEAQELLNLLTQIEGVI